MTRLLAVILLLIAFATPPTAAEAQMTMSQVKALYKKHRVKARFKANPITAKDAAKMEADARAAGRPKAAKSLRAFRAGLSGATVHVVRYRGSGYTADFVEHEGQVKLAYFFLPIFTTTGAPPPRGTIEVATEVAARMTGGRVSVAGFRKGLEASMNEAHRYSDGTSTNRYPGVVFAKARGYKYSIQALVPDYIELTVSRVPSCRYTYRANGWLAQHLCAAAK